MTPPRSIGQVITDATRGFRVDQWRKGSQIKDVRPSLNELEAEGFVVLPRSTPDATVIEAPAPEGTKLWFVASRYYARDAFWPVRLSNEGMTCPCPRSVQQAELPLELRESCRHQKAVWRYEDAKNPRPTAPVNVSAMVD